MLNDPTSRVMNLEQAVCWRNSLKMTGKKLVVTNGCFDILHRGHAVYLHASRNSGDALLVLLNSDASIRNLKGESRPVNDQESRAILLASLAAVDAVVIFDSEICADELRAIQPDIYVKGGDYTVETLNPIERQALLECGCQFKFIPFVNGFSTTSIIQKIN